MKRRRKRDSGCSFGGRLNCRLRQVKKWIHDHDFSGLREIHKRSILGAKVGKEMRGEPLNDLEEFQGNSDEEGEKGEKKLNLIRNQIPAIGIFHTLIRLLNRMFFFRPTKTTIDSQVVQTSNIGGAIGGIPGVSHITPFTHEVHERTSEDSWHLLETWIERRHEVSGEWWKLFLIYTTWPRGRQAVWRTISSAFPRIHCHQDHRHHHHRRWGKSSWVGIFHLGEKKKEVTQDHQLKRAGEKRGSYPLIFSWSSTTKTWLANSS